MTKLHEFHDAHMAALHETRELMIRAIGKIDTLESQRRADVERMMAIEDSCEQKRMEYIELKPLLGAVYGTGAHDPGLLARFRKLETNVVTKTAVVALAGFVAALVAAVTEVVVALTDLMPHLILRK